MAVLLANNAASRLTAGINDADTTVQVEPADADAFPTPADGEWFPLTVEHGPTGREVMRCTARSGTSLTVERAQEGTDALSFPAGAVVELRATVGALLAAFASSLQGMLAQTAMQPGAFGLGGRPENAIDLNDLPRVNIACVGADATTLNTPDSGLLWYVSQRINVGSDNRVQFAINRGANLPDIRYRRCNNSEVWTTWSPNISGHDKATVAYVDAAIAGQDVAPVRASAVGNINLSAPGSTIDGVSMSNGQSFIAADQSSPAANGIYVFNGASSAATRRADSDTWAEIIGKKVYVEAGSTRAGWSYRNQNVAGGSLGSTAVSYIKTGETSAYTGGTGITVGGNVVSIATAMLDIINSALQPGSFGVGREMGSSGSQDDLDSYTTSGQYIIGSSATNSPFPGAQVILNVAVGGNNRVHHLVMAPTLLRKVERFLNNSGWSPWRDADSGLDQLSYQWNANGPVLSLPEYMRRRYIDVGAYCSLTDTADVRAGVAAALADAAGREMVFTAPYGQASRRYRRTSRSGGFWSSTTPPSRIVFEGGYLDCADIDPEAGHNYFAFNGSSSGTSHTLASHGMAGNNQIVLTSGGANYAPGDYVIVHSNGYFGLPENAASEQRGEFARVKARSGNTLTLYGPLEDNYITTTNARVTKVNLTRAPIIENPQIYGPGRPTASGLTFDRGFSFYYTIGGAVIGGKIERVDYNGIRLNNSIHWMIDGVEMLFDPQIAGDDSHIQYGIVALNAASYGEIKNCLIWGGKHGVDHSRNSEPGVGRHIDIHHNRIRDTWSSAIATHNNCERWHVTDNSIIGCNSGVNIRTRNSQINDNVIIFTPNANVGHGVDLRTDMVGLEVQRNEIHGGRFGVRINAGALVPGGGQRFLVNENKIYNPSQNGILALFDDGGHKDNIFINRNLIRDAVSIAISVQGQNANARVRRGSIAENEIWGGSSAIAIQGNWMERMAIINNRTDRATPVSVANSTNMLTAPNHSLA